MFFSQFFTWLQGQLATYVSSNVVAVAAAIEPAAVTLAIVYVMVWGWLSMTGRIQEPIMEGAKRIVLVAVVLGVALRLWLYNSVVVDTFTNGPAQLAQAILGASSPVALVDQIWLDGGNVAIALMNEGGLTDGSFWIAGGAVYFFVGLACVATAFLIALSMFAIAVLLTLGPFFIVMLLFDASRRFFEHWVSQLANYALITILVAMVAALLLGVMRSYAQNAVALGSAVTIAEGARLCLVAALIFLVMRQIPNIAAALAAGVALGTYSAVSRVAASAMTGTRGFIEGASGIPRSRFDSAPRLGGSVAGQTVRGLFIKGPQRQGGTVSRDRVMPPRIVR